MCMCTPNIRTPWCGRGDCQPPKPPGTRKMLAEDIGLRACKYGQAYAGDCGAIIFDGHRFCLSHRSEKCTCGQPATGQCSFAGQFVCGYPICGDCTHDMDGLHKRRQGAPPVRQITAEDLGVPTA